MSKEQHRIKHHIWRGGILTVFEEFFDSFEAALRYSHSLPAQQVKIYSSTGDLVHSAGPTAPSAEESYA